MTDDQKLEADQLPSGFVPLWFDIKKKGEMSQREILEKISELEEIAGLSVTVLYDDEDEDSSGKQFCDEIKWKYRHYHDMRGSAGATGWDTSPHTDPRFASEYCKSIIIHQMLSFKQADPLIVIRS